MAEQPKVYINNIKAHETVYIQIINDSKRSLLCIIQVDEYNKEEFIVYPLSASLWYEEPEGDYNWSCRPTNKRKR